MDLPDYYKILGVANNASQDEIKKTFRKQSLEHHPDRGGDGEIFKQISEAYECLGDKDERKKYDMMRNNPLFGAMGGMGGMHEVPVNPADLFGMLFGGGPMGRMNSMAGMPDLGDFANMGPGIHVFHNGMPVNVGRGGGGGGGGNFNGPTFNNINKPSPITKTVQIDIAMAYIGCSIPIPIERWVENPNQRSKIRETETVYVDIPPGIDNDESIVVEKKGNAIIVNEEIRGDIKLFIKVENKTDLIRKGLDLHYIKKVTLKEAICGFMFEINYVDGKKFKINNKKGNIITPGSNKIIPKLGMKRDDKVGNLIIEFEVQFPDTLNEEAINKLEEVL